MKVKVLLVAFMMLGFSINAAAETRTVDGFVGKKVLAFDADFKNPKQMPVGTFAGVGEATKHPSRPFYKLDVNGMSYWVSESAIEFADKARGSTIICNTERSDFKNTNTFTSMGSREKTECK